MNASIRERSLVELADAYRSGELEPVEVTEAYLAAIEEQTLGRTDVYRRVTAERALEQARRARQQFRSGIDTGPLQGIPIALKDLIGARGETNAAGSRVLADAPPEPQDSPVAARLDAAGAVFLGRTTMTELAFSGLGLNPHFGTAPNVLDDARIPGGSSSGSGVAVASGLACAAIGSDTGGSVRIPASFNGIVGLKTTDGAVPTDGCTPLSTTLDTIGPLTRTVHDAYHVWRALEARPHKRFEPKDVRGLRLMIPRSVLFDDIDPAVAEAFREACDRLEAAGAELRDSEAPILRSGADAFARYGSLAALEAFALYEDLIETHGERMDPRVSKRILAAKERSAADYIRLLRERRRVQTTFWDENHGCDAVLYPTVAILPPRIDELEADEAYFRINALVLRNTAVFNFLGVPAVSVPCARTSEGLSVGFGVAGRPHHEGLVLRIAAAVERLRA